MFNFSLRKPKDAVQGHERAEKIEIDLKDLNISCYGVLSTSFEAILKTDTARDQIEALKNVKVINSRGTAAA